ncbi:CU044_5270 family protein [Micromonospora chersina]|uniref:CU044_5270 family protein n=1 Tax=Micromonospora chersina TaxID=47854 RepID=UPI0037983908
MNATPIRPGSNEHEELARLLPQPAERDLPSDRHRQLQEFVMNHIQQDLRQGTRNPRRSPRRLAYLTSAVAAVAVAAVAVGTGTFGGAGTSVTSGGGASTEPAPASASGRQILLAAATSAEKLPLDTRAYWYVKIVSTGSRNGESWLEETWTARDGRTWSRGSYQNPAAESASPPAFPEGKSDDKLIEVPQPSPFSLGGAKVTIEQLQAAPIEPTSLKAWIANLVRNSNIRTSAGKLTDAQQRQHVFEGLVSLVSLLPAPPSVRAAALRVIASYPNVTSLGPVDGGRGLLISFHPEESPARLVIDPQTGQLRRTNVLIPTFGGTLSNDGGTFAITAEWTNTLPQ